jgi:hypothetical protein
VRKEYSEMRKTKMSKIKDSKDGVVNEKRRFFYKNKESDPINKFRFNKRISIIQNRVLILTNDFFTKNKK